MQRMRGDERAAVATRESVRGEGGWTLLEMLVVCSIISILTATAVPRFSGLARQLRAGTASTQLLADLNWARAMAVRTGVPHYVDVDTSAPGVNYWVRRSSSPPTIQPAADPVVRNAHLGTRLSGVGFALAGASADPWGGQVSAPTPGRMVFDSRGLPSSSGSFFIATDDGASARAVSVTGAGRIRLFTRSGGGWQ